jgi:hypothetical protein
MYCLGRSLPITWRGTNTPFLTSTHINLIHLLCPIRQRRSLLILLRLPFLDEGQELWVTRNIFSQDLWDIEALWGLIVLEDAAEGAFSRADYMSQLAIASVPQNT